MLREVVLEVSLSVLPHFHLVAVVGSNSIGLTPGLVNEVSHKKISGKKQKLDIK